MFEARFQSFDDVSDRTASAPRVKALRAELKRRGLDGFVVPRADRQQNEYLPASEERLAWLTGFTGSAGAAIVLADRAALFVGGRYTVQAASENIPLEDDIPEEIGSLHYDLAGPLIEEFVLGVDPYPRAPGVEFEVPGDKTEAPESPFAVLKGLKSGL